jgi:TolC family type I secretion outer membrane protein
LRARPARSGLWLALALLLLTPLPAARAQTLAQSLTTAYETNPTLLAARAELRAVNEGVPQAISGWRPNVVLQGSVGGETTNTTFDDEDVPSAGWTTQVPREMSLELRQPIYRGGRTAAAVDSAEKLVLAQRQLLKDTEQTVLLAVAQSYMDVWRDQAILALRINNEERLRRQREAALDRFNVGEITRTDVAQAESRLAGATADVIAAQGQLETSRAIFRQVVGLEPISITQAPPLQGIPNDVQSMVTLALQDEPTVVASRFLENSALADVRERLGRLLPEVSLVGLLLYQEGTTTAGIENKSAQIRAEVSVPLYQQGTTYSQVRQAKQVASQRRLEISESLREAEREAVAAWEALITARAQIAAFQAQVQAAQIALDGVVQENTVGARTVLDILDAEQEVLDAQVSLVGAQRDEVVASFRVAAAIGRLTALDLALPVTIYDPQIDYAKVRNAWFGLSAPGVDD